MVGYDDTNNALTLGDDDSLSVGDYELEYNSTDDEWQARYGRPIGGDLGNHGDIRSAEYNTNAQTGTRSLNFGGEGYVDSKTKLSIDTDATFSCAFWLNLDQAPTNFKWFVGDEDGDDASGWAVRNGGTDREKLRFQWRGSGGALSVNSDNPVLTNSWIHVTATFDGTDANGVTLYVDGSEIPSTVGENNPFDNSSKNIFVGERSTGGGGVVGLMDDVRIYSKILSSTEVNDIFNGVNVTDSLELHYDFEYPETPDVAIDSTGDVYPKNNIPRSTSGSLVPSGLAESVSAGEALADDGNTYASVQTAVNNASGWVFVGPGTFNEAVTISTAGLTLEGVGRNTLIDGGTTGPAITVDSVSNVTVRNLSIQTTGGGGTSNSAFQRLTSGDALTVDGVIVRDSDSAGFRTDGGFDHTFTDCIVEAADTEGFHMEGERIIVRGCTIRRTDVDNGVVIRSADDSIVANCQIRNCGSEGILMDGNDGIAIGNRISNVTDDGLEARQNDNILANNRISGSNGIDLNDNGTGTVLDGNSTGAAN